VQTFVDAMSFFSIVFSRWQHHIRWRFAILASSKESSNPILLPDAAEFLEQQTWLNQKYG